MLATSLACCGLVVGGGPSAFSALGCQSVPGLWEALSRAGGASPVTDQQLLLSWVPTSDSWAPWSQLSTATSCPGRTPLGLLSASPLSQSCCGHLCVPSPFVLVTGLGPWAQYQHQHQQLQGAEVYLGAGIGVSPSGQQLCAEAMAGGPGAGAPGRREGRSLLGEDLSSPHPHPRHHTGLQDPRDSVTLQKAPENTRLYRDLRTGSPASSQAQHPERHGPCILSSLAEPG